MMKFFRTYWIFLMLTATYSVVAQASDPQNVLSCFIVNDDVVSVSELKQTAGQDSVRYEVRHLLTENSQLFTMHSSASFLNQAVNGSNYALVFEVYDQLVVIKHVKGHYSISSVSKCNQCEEYEFQEAECLANGNVVVVAKILAIDSSSSVKQKSKGLFFTVIDTLGNSYYRYEVNTARSRIELIYTWEVGDWYFYSTEYYGTPYTVQLTAVDAKNEVVFRSEMTKDKTFDPILISPYRDSFLIAGQIIDDRRYIADSSLGVFMMKLDSTGEHGSFHIVDPKVKNELFRKRLERKFLIGESLNKFISNGPFELMPLSIDTSDGLSLTLESFSIGQGTTMIEVLGGMSDETERVLSLYDLVKIDLSNSLKLLEIKSVYRNGTNILLDRDLERSSYQFAIDQMHNGLYSFVRTNDSIAFYQTLDTFNLKFTAESWYSNNSIEVMQKHLADLYIHNEAMDTFEYKGALKWVNRMQRSATKFYNKSERSMEVMAVSITDLDLYYQPNNIMLDVTVIDNKVVYFYLSRSDNIFKYGSFKL